MPYEIMLQLELPEDQPDPHAAVEALGIGHREDLLLDDELMESGLLDLEFRGSNEENGPEELLEVVREIGRTIPGIHLHGALSFQYDDQPLRTVGVSMEALTRALLGRE